VTLEIDQEMEPDLPVLLIVKVSSSTPLSKVMVLALNSIDACWLLELRLTSHLDVIPATTLT
jgi:hypothetical protein